MGIRFWTPWIFILVISCIEKENPTSRITEDTLSVEQLAVDFFINELINEDSLFFIQGNDGLVIELRPQTFLEDSLFIDGLFFWKKIYATEEIQGLSNVSHASYELELYGAEKEDIERTREFERDYALKNQMELPKGRVDFPSSISVVDNNIKKRYLDNSLFLEVKHHLESRDQYLVEISVYNLEYDEYKSILVYLDREFNVLDWKM